MNAQSKRIYNLPSDGHGYPKFNSFKERRDYIKSNVIFSQERIEFFQKLDEENNDTAEKGSQIIKAQMHYVEKDMANQQDQIEDERSLKLQDVGEFCNSSNSNKDPLQLIPNYDNPIKCSDLVFVGDSTTLFTPHRGDLIIFKTEIGQGFHRRGYIGFYESLHTNILEGDLVVRIGQYDKIRHSQGLLVKKPYETLELYKLNLDGTWQYLGSQARITNGEMAIASSPGKYLKIGAQFGSLGKFHPLVPGRGDVIIKKEALSDSFSHEENLWHSMIKWHRGQEVALGVGDFLLCLVVDKERLTSHAHRVHTTAECGDHSGCVLHGECKESHPPLSFGFAELYQKVHDVSRWTFRGRTKLHFDIDSQKANNPRILYYTEDDGQYRDLDMEEPSF